MSSRLRLPNLWIQMQKLGQTMVWPWAIHTAGLSLGRAMARPCPGPGRGLVILQTGLPLQLLPVLKRITKVFPRLEVTRNPSSYGCLPVPMAAQVRLPSLEVTRSLSSYGFLPAPVAAQLVGLCSGNIVMPKICLGSTPVYFSPTRLAFGVLIVS